MTRQAISELLVRVRAADGPDRGIDAAIAVVTHRFGHAELLPDPQQGQFYYEIDYPDRPDDDPQEFGAAISPSYTSSLDAIVSLIERELPEWAWKITKDYVRGNCCAVVRNAGSLDMIAPAWVQTAPSPALALCAAFLSAKLETMEQGVDG